jgi:hypothetical protein
VDETRQSSDYMHVSWMLASHARHADVDVGKPFISVVLVSQIPNCVASSGTRRYGYRFLRSFVPESFVAFLGLSMQEYIILLVRINLNECTSYHQAHA